jgi:hypothetical protein
MTSDKTTGDSEKDSYEYEVPEGDDVDAFLTNMDRVGNSVYGDEEERRKSYNEFIALRKDPERSIESFLEAQMIVASNKSAELFWRARLEEENLSGSNGWNKIAMLYKYSDKFQHRAMQLAETIMKT